MKLYYAPGACSLSPHIVLRELELPFTTEAVDIRAKKTASGADFRTINPKGYVPALALEEDDEVLTEGVAIVQYLVDKHAPGTLAPAAGTVARAKVNAHLNFLSAELHKAFSPLFNPAIAPDAREKQVELVGSKLDLIEAALGDDAYLSGDAFSVADAYLFVLLSWAPKFDIDLSRWPRLVDLSKRVGERPAVQAAIAAEAGTV